MYAAFAQALETADGGHLATGHNVLIAIRIARQATEQAIAARAPESGNKPAAYES